MSAVIEAQTTRRRSRSSQGGPRSLQTSRSRWSEKLFEYVTLGFGLVVVAIILWIAARLYLDSDLTRHKFGLGMLTSTTWDVPKEIYGAAPYIYGTLVSSILALLFAVPLSVAAALFLNEIAPKWLSTPLSFIIELLAAVPSIIFGLWGFYVLCPFLQNHISPWLHDHLGSIPFFGGSPVLTNVLAASCILAIMILPIITAVSREVLRTIPTGQRDASLGLGATKWETLKHVVLPEARSGITGAAILGIGRAIGETMAVVMVIGNSPQIKLSLLQPGYTMPSLLANQFNEANNDPLQRSALLEIALLLFVITLIVNGIARFVLMNAARKRAGRAAPTNPTLAFLSRVSEIVSQWAVPLIVGALFLTELVADVKAHGLMGLFGPVELIGYAYLAFKFATRGVKTGTALLKLRKLTDRSMNFLIAGSAVLAGLVLGAVSYYVFVKGFSALHMSLFTHLPKPPGEEGGGLKNAIVGTLMLVSIAFAIGVPIGLMGGVFIAEFKQRRAGPIIRFAADVLNGVPSVVIGLFAYAAFVLPFHHFSAWAGGAALGIMMIPTIIRTTEEMIRLVPHSYREASLALGATHLRTTWSIMLPAARSGIVTGIMLATARVAGETAPLLFTAFGSDSLVTNPAKEVSSLTMKIYQYANSPYDDWIAQAWGGALVLLLIITVFSLAARFATRGARTKSA